MSARLGRRRIRAAMLAGAWVALTAAACSGRPPDDTKDYVARIAADRAAKDASLQATSDPIPASRRAEFLPLAYFPIDPSYNVPAQLRPATDREEIEMPTSTGTKRLMRRAGRLDFSLKGQPQHLTAFVEAAAGNVNHLFVPFSDLTSATETYAAGRYLDLERNATGIYMVDFNRAYHPFCYYNPTYECPYPPAENRLSLPIHAGEKIKK